MADDIRALILGLLNSGELKSPVTYRGETLTKYGEANSGWDFVDKSSIGAPMSRGVEALRQALNSQGRDDLAIMLPKYHVCDFWRNDTFNYGFASGANKFVFNDYDKFGLTKNEADSIINVLLWMDHRYFEAAIFGDPKIIAKMYRGESDGTGFSANDTIYGNGAWKLAQKPSIPHLPGPYLNTGPDGKHFVYDIYFDAYTDEDITRYWTSWARAFGANV
jgi:hypothetical protein